MWRHTFKGLLVGIMLIGCTGKDGGDTSVDDIEVDEPIQITLIQITLIQAQPLKWTRSIQPSTFTVVLRSDEVYGQGQTHSNWNTISRSRRDGFEIGFVHSR